MIEIALCTDNNYAMPAGVMIHSVCKHTDNVRFHVIVPDNFSEKNRSRIELTVARFGASVVFIPIDEEILDGFPVMKTGQASHVTVATYYRLFLDRLLPDSLEKILYLDCDLICQESLEELWNIDIDNIPLACVSDVPYTGVCEAERLGYDSALGYFNAGVLLINLAYWRKNLVFPKFMDYVKVHSEELLSHDQDVLNYVFQGRVKFISPRYNALDLLFHREFLNYPYTKNDLNQARFHPVIVHFSYKFKPWIKGYGHPYRNRFLEYKRNTPWKHAKLRMAKSDSLKGAISNVFVFLGLHTYTNDYLVID